MARTAVIITPGVGQNIAVDTDASSRAMQVVVFGIPGSNNNQTADLDSGGGSNIQHALGVLLAASGGPVPLQGDATYGLWANIKQMPGASRPTDALGAALATDAIMNALVALTPKFFKANIAASQTDANLVTAVGGKIIRPLLLAIHAGGTATNITFNSKPAGAGAAISSLYAMGANGGRERPFSPVGLFQTVSGEGLTCTTGAGSTTGIDGVYVEV